MAKKLFKVSLILILALSLFSTSSFAVVGTVTGNNVRIRERADSNSFEVSLATKNEKVDVIGEEGNWYKVNFENVTGYISKDYVDTDYSSGSSTSSTPTTTPEPNLTTEPEQPKDITPSTGIEEPSNNTIAGTNETTPEPNEPVNNTVTEPENEVNDTTPTAPIVSNSEVKEEQKVTFENEVDLKYLPSFTSRSSSKTVSGTIYTVKASLNNWVKVENETTSGWVLKINIKEANEETTKPTTTDMEQPDSSQPSSEVMSPDNSSAPTETPSQDSVKKGTVNVESARIRRSPNGETLDSIKEGEEVTILGEEDGWYHIKTEDYDSCYIAKRLITEK